MSKGKAISEYKKRWCLLVRLGQGKLTISSERLLCARDTLRREYHYSCFCKFRKAKALRIKKKVVGPGMET